MNNHNEKIGSFRRLNLKEQQEVAQLLKPFGYFYEGFGSIGVANVEGTEQFILNIDYHVLGGGRGDDPEIGKRLKEKFGVDAVYRGGKIAQSEQHLQHHSSD